MRSLVWIGCLALVSASAAAEAAEVEVWLSSEDGEYALTRVEAPAFAPVERLDTEAIVVDETRRFQSILGLGASLEHATCYNLARLSEEKRAEVVERLVNPETGIGMNLMRLCIGTSDFAPLPYYSYNELPEGQTDPELTQFSIDKDRAYLLPVIKLALEKNPGMLFFASPWSPPGWMKSTGKLGGGRMLDEHFASYAQYFVKYIKAYAAEGIPIHAVTIQNEPHMVHPDYPTCLWKAEQQRDFIRDHLGPAFRENTLDALIWCWDHNWNKVEFPTTVLSDPEAAQYVDGTGFHLYEGKVEAQTVLHEAFPGKHIYFTEGSTFRTRGAIEIIEILRNWARAYNAWVIMLDQDRGPNSGPHNASPTCIMLQEDGSVEYRFDYYMYGQFMKFVPRGAVRIATPDGGPRFANVAFRTPDGVIVLVVANAERDAKAFKVVWEGAAFDTSLPGRAVGTYRWKAE